MFSCPTISQVFRFERVPGIIRSKATSHHERKSPFVMSEWLICEAPGFLDLSVLGYPRSFPMMATAIPATTILTATVPVAALVTLLAVALSCALVKVAPSSARVPLARVVPHILRRRE